jgi:phage repressor protein C with HTH and peptisase S24 domain
MTAENNSKAAKFLRVDPDWLATGEGLMRTERIWPFGSEIAPQQYFALPQEATRPAIDVLLAAVRRSEADHSTPGVMAQVSGAHEMAESMFERATREAAEKRQSGAKGSKT